MREKKIIDIGPIIILLWLFMFVITLFFSVFCLIRIKDNCIVVDLYQKAAEQ